MVSFASLDATTAIVLFIVWPSPHHNSLKWMKWNYFSNFNHFILNYDKRHRTSEFSTSKFNFWNFNIDLLCGVRPLVRDWKQKVFCAIDRHYVIDKYFIFPGTNPYNRSQYITFSVQKRNRRWWLPMSVNGSGLTCGGKCEESGPEEIGKLRGYIRWKDPF